MSTPDPPLAPFLDPQAAAVLRSLDSLLPVTTSGSPPEVARGQYRLMIKHLRTAPPEPFAGSVVDEVVRASHGLIPVRRYTPTGWPTHGPVTVWMHGGGWVLGDLDSAEPSASVLASVTGTQVVSVDYRLAPEHPFPAAFDDCLAVVRAEATGAASLRAASTNVQSTNEKVEHPTPPPWLAVGGDSAGGNLAAAVALAAPAAGIALDAALLVYPAVDSSMQSASYATFSHGFLLTAEAMSHYWNAYAAGLRGNHFQAPQFDLSRTVDLSLFPPTVVTTAGFDPLRDEGDTFARRLVECGVPVVHLQAKQLTHGWLDMTDQVAAARAERTRTFAALKGFLASK